MMKGNRILGTLFMFFVAFWILSGGVSARAARFTDVSANAWYAEAVYFVRDNGIMDATSDTNFSPDGTMTCAELVEVFHRMKGRPAATSRDALLEAVPVSEIPTDSGEQEAAAWAAEQGLLAGYDAGAFHAQRGFPRGYLFDLLHRLVGRPILNHPVKTPFSDELTAPAVFEASIRWARESEIIPKAAGKLLDPNTPGTRAYVAAVLQKFLSVYPSQKTAEPVSTTPVTPNKTTPDTATYQPFLLSAVYFPDVPAYPKQDRNDWSGYYEALAEWRDFRRLPEAQTQNMDTFFTKVVKLFLSGDGKENKVCSPLNLYIALGMLADTTAGNSQKQLLSLLGANSMEEVRERVKAIWAADYHDDDTNTCTLANSFWMNQTWFDEHGAPKRSATDSLAENFYASAFSGAGGTEAYNQAFQAWINEQTGDLLTDLIQNQEISEDTVLALVSAINFHAGWTDKFYADDNTKGKFYSNEGKVIVSDCEFMHETDSVYYAGKKFGAVSKSLSHGGKMWFILPNKGVTPEKLLAEKELAEFLFKDPSAFYYESKADVLIVKESIPKFDISGKLDLKEGLRQLGVTDILSPSTANFTPLWEPQTQQDKDNNLNLYVSDAEHDARITIDEEGCSAAAVTIIHMAAAGAGRPSTTETIDFILDRPFLIMVTDANSLPLFMATVNRPVE